MAFTGNVLLLLHLRQPEQTCAHVRALCVRSGTPACAQAHGMAASRRHTRQHRRVRKHVNSTARRHRIPRMPASARHALMISARESMPLPFALAGTAVPPSRFVQASRLRQQLGKERDARNQARLALVRRAKARHHAPKTYEALAETS